MKAAPIVGQTLAYFAFFAAVGYLSFYPAYTHMQPDVALVRINIGHSGKRFADCKRMSWEEISKLPPHERRPHDCPRERMPVYVEVDLDGRNLYRESLVPLGFHRDGVSTTYQRFPVAPGKHHVVARLRDSKREKGFDYERAEDVVLVAGQNFVVDFQADTGGFKFR
jgi:hypothetical protein